MKAEFNSIESRSHGPLVAEGNARDRDVGRILVATTTMRRTNLWLSFAMLSLCCNFTDAQNSTEPGTNFIANVMGSACGVPVPDDIVGAWSNPAALVLLACFTVVMHSAAPLFSKGISLLFKTVREPISSAREFIARLKGGAGNKVVSVFGGAGEEKKWQGVGVGSEDNQEKIHKEGKGGLREMGREVVTAKVDEKLDRADEMLDKADEHLTAMEEGLVGTIEDKTAEIEALNDASGGAKEEDEEDQEEEEEEGGEEGEEESSVVKEPDKANATYDVLLQVRSRRQG